ncbi:MAG: S1C family serine protease [Reyranellaceae bacterium]
MALKLVGSLAFLAALCLPPLSQAQTAPPGPVLGVSSKVPEEARTARTLGIERSGSGVVIDGDGLVVTVGYLIMEAREVTLDLPDGKSIPASIVAYDYDSGFGLLRAAVPVKLKAARLGDSDAVAAKQELRILAGGQYGGFPFPVFVADRRDFAGYWEYLLEQAIFTAPPFPGWGGAALLDGEEKLVGIGSLLVKDAGARGQELPGNMFIPINRIKPILADMLASGKVSAPARPWLGLYTLEAPAGLMVTYVTPEGPAHKAGLRPGDRIVSVGGVEVDDLVGFYRGIWAKGDAGVTVDLDIRRGEEEKKISVPSVDRTRFLKLDNSL